MNIYILLSEFRKISTFDQNKEITEQYDEDGNVTKTRTEILESHITNGVDMIKVKTKDGTIETYRSLVDIDIPEYTTVRTTSGIGKDRKSKLVLTNYYGFHVVIETYSGASLTTDKAIFSTIGDKVYIVTDIGGNKYSYIGDSREFSIRKKSVYGEVTDHIVYPNGRIKKITKLHEVNSMTAYDTYTYLESGLPVYADSRRYTYKTTYDVSEVRCNDGLILSIPLP